MGSDRALSSVCVSKKKRINLFLLSSPITLLWTRVWRTICARFIHVGAVMEGSCPVCNKTVSLLDADAHVVACLRKNNTEGVRKEPAACSKSPSSLRQSVLPGQRKRQAVDAPSSPIQAKQRKGTKALSPFVGSGSSKFGSASSVKLPRSPVVPEGGGGGGEIASTTDSTGQVSSSSIKGQYSRSPLAELVRPRSMANYIGQETSVGTNTPLRRVLETGEIPSMIFWGPTGCGKVRQITY